VLGAVAVAGPSLFTLTWVVLGWSHAGYRPRQETISSLSAHDVPAWGWMVAGQLALALGFLALALLLPRGLGRLGLVPAVFAGLAAYGTVQPRSAYPRSQWLHGTGTGVAFGGVLVACLATAVVAWRLGPAVRDVAVVSTVVFAVSMPHVVWFLLSAENTWHGFAEKVFLVALGGWVAWCGGRLAWSAPADA